VDVSDVTKKGIENTRAFIEAIGFKHNFHIYKPFVYIFEFEDVFLPYYTVVDDATNSVRHFIEIEVKEDKLDAGMTENEAWGIIEHWEGVLKPLGITPQHRLRKSIFEIYRQDKKIEVKND
jgi:adenylate cyclase class IV